MLRVDYSCENTDQLMDRIKRSNRKAFQCLFDRYWEVTYAIAKSMLKDAIIAEDLTQEVWISLWERRGSIQNENIESYLKNAVKFRVFKEFRDGKFSKGHLDYIENLPTLSSPQTDEKIIYLETKETLHRAMNTLPERCRQVFQLSRDNDLSNDEIAKKLNISIRTVESHISNALKDLRLKIHSFLF